MASERVFYLVEDPAAIRQQLKGQVLTTGKKLEAGISTDIIFPTNAVLVDFNRYGDYAMTGHPHIRENDLSTFSPDILVVGDDFGKGSSREHAPWSLKQSGIKWIVCEGRLASIFAENCVAIGIQILESPLLPFHEDEIISLVETTIKDQQKHRGLLNEVVQLGGLSQYNIERQIRNVTLPEIRHNEVSSDYPLTASEKILASHFVNIASNKHGQLIVKPGDIGFIATDLRMSYELHTPIIANILESELHSLRISDSASIHLFQDHSALAIDYVPDLKKLVNVQKTFADNNAIFLHTSTSRFEQTDGICHTIMVEESLLTPGQTGIGTDSHTCSLGVLNALAWGVGATHMANAFVTKEALVEVPASIKINLEGQLPKGVCTKDLMLAILSDPFVVSGKSTGTIIEYVGDGLDSMQLDEQLVLTNMAVEAKAMTGIIARLTPALKKHLTKTRKLTENEIMDQFVSPDSDANYLHTINIDLGSIEPMIALPGDPTNGMPISQLPRTIINTAYIGSCTGGNYNDLERAARILEDNNISPDVALYIQAASRKILEKAQNNGLIKIFEDSGALIIGMGCGACIGLGPGRVGDEGTTISATNRNFSGRMGGSASVYLASPETVALAAVQGYIGS